MIPVALTDKLEKQWDSDLFSKKDGLATMLGWDSFWTFRAKGSRAGFPDRTIVRERIIYAELKRELTGKKSEDYQRQPSVYQREWLDKLARAGAEVYLWRPSDLDEIARILGKPWRFEWRTGPGPVLYTVTEPMWTPGSLWVLGRGRHDTEETT